MLVYLQFCHVSLEPFPSLLSISSNLTAFFILLVFSLTSIFSLDRWLPLALQRFSQPLVILWICLHLQQFFLLLWKKRSCSSLNLIVLPTYTVDPMFFCHFRIFLDYSFFIPCLLPLSFYWLFSLLHLLYHKNIKTPMTFPYLSPVFHNQTS